MDARKNEARHKITFKHERWGEYQRDKPQPGDTDNIFVLAHRELYGDTRPEDYPTVGDMFERMDNAGLFKMFTARDAGRLVGYVNFMVAKSIHPGPSWIEARHNSVYVRPEYRGWIPIALLKFAEKELAAMGVSAISFGTRLDRPLGKLYERMGYKPIEIIYHRVLKK